jgi:hypothetical protein
MPIESFLLKSLLTPAWFPRGGAKNNSFGTRRKINIISPAIGFRGPALFITLLLRMRYFVLLLFSLPAFWGCQPDEACFSSATNRLVVDFYRSSPAGPQPDTVVVGQVRSTVSDSLFWNNDTDRTRRILLYLNPDADSTIFLFERQTPSLRRDSLVLGYERRYRLIAPDCALEVIYRDLRVLRSTFSNALIINTELQEPSNEADLHLFY